MSEHTEYCLSHTITTSEDVLSPAEEDLLRIPQAEAAFYFKGNLPLETDRLILRPFEDTDTKMLTKTITRMRGKTNSFPSVSMGYFINDTTGQIYCPPVPPFAPLKKQGYRLFYYFDNNVSASELAKKFISQAQKEYKTGGTMRLAVTEKATGALVGNVTIDIPKEGRMAKNLFSSENKKAPLQGDLGYFLDPEQEGKGYAREAAQAVVNLYLSLMYPHVTLTVHPDNTPSNKLAKALGAEKIGFLEQSSHNGEPRILYSIHRGPKSVARQENNRYTQHIQ